MVPPKILGLGQEFCHVLEFLHLPAGKKPARPPVHGHVQRVLGANDNAAICGQGLFLGQGGIRLFAAVIPGKFHRPALFVFGKQIFYNGPLGRSFIVHGGRLRLNRQWITQIQRPIGKVLIVATHVAQCARAKVPPTAPLEGHIRRMIRPLGRGPQPQVPIKRVGHQRLVLGPINPLWPNRSIGPYMRLLYLAQYPRLDEFHQPA